jgi:ABC-type transport system involved in multi-copper enzyme maturation permease subunit
MAAFVIARLTFREAVRRKIVLAALLLGGAFLILYGIGFYGLATETMPTGTGALTALLKNQIFNFLTMAGVYAVNFLCIAMGALLSADTLAGEIGSGTIQALVTKPVRRAEIVLGKWLGFAILLLFYLVFMVAGVMLIVYLLSGYSVPNVATGIAIIYLESLLIMSITLALSSTLSTLATGGTIFGLYGLAFIGGWVEQIGALVNNQTVVNIGIVSSFIIPSEALLRRAMFEMTTALVQTLGMSAGPVMVASVPSPAMLVYAALYLVAALVVAVRRFGRRDL